MPIYLRIISFNLFSAVLVFFVMPPLNAWFIGCFSLLFPLYNLKKYHDLKVCFWNGFFYGVLFYFAVFFWMPRAIVSITGLSGVISWALFFSIIGCAGILYGVLFWCIRKFSVADGAMPFLWVLFEMIALPVLPLSCGYFFHSSQLVSQSASLLGVYGLGVFTVYLNLVVIQFFSKENKANLPRLLVLFLAMLLFGYYHKVSIWTESKHKSVGVVVVHTGIEPTTKRNDSKGTYEKVMVQLKTAINSYPAGKLFVLPESIFVPMIRDEVDARLLEIKLLLQPHQAVLLGCNTNFMGGIANSVVLIDHEYPEKMQVYRKRHLMLVGEYMPFAKMFPNLLDSLLNEKDLNQFVPGLKNTSFKHGELKIAPGVCFEHMFSFEVASTVHELQPDLLVNVSEDGWFASKRASLLHLLMIKMRSIETGKALVRSVNVGVSALVLPDGYVSITNDYQNRPLQGDGSGEIIYLEVPLGGASTIYSKYGYFLPYLLLFCFALIYWKSHHRKSVETN